MFKGSASFEVQVRQEGRWRIEATFTEEQAALSCARAQLVGHGVQEVKVFKARSLAGLAIQTAIFHRKVPEVKERPLGLSGSPEGAPFCTELADLYGFDSRVVIGRMLRQFLDKFRITQTELLHGWSFARKLDEQGSLIGAAVHAVARHHADLGKVNANARVKELRALVDQAIIRARDFAAERKRLPAFDPKDLAGTSRRIEYAVGPAEHDYVFLSVLALHLSDANSLGGKVDMLLDLMDEGLEPRLNALLEGVVADALGSAELVKELLGAQANLADGLCALADVLHGRAADPKLAPVGRSLARIGGLTVAGHAPCCRRVLVDRVRSALNSDQPLDRRDPMAEASLIDAVVAHLRGTDGALLGGAETEKALAKRLLRHRQALLRRQGMHDIADGLAAIRPN
ncbi:MAG TPA: hypothetical protein VGE72_15520 [Azospirillum sp.]